METLARRIHHITVCPGSAQEDVDFFTQVLGQRLIKQTVLMDGQIPVYHLYYGNADADIGSITTTFPYARRVGRPGSGQLTATVYSAPTGTVSFWKEHFERHALEHSGILERFGRKFVRVRHPAGLLFEIMETDRDPRRPWTTAEVTRDVAPRGFAGAVFSVRDVCEQEQFLVEALGFRRVGVDGPYHRFEVACGGPGQVIDLHHEPDRLPGSWGFGAGTAHHIAFDLDTDEALLRQKAWYEELGYTDASEIKDRYYFHSMYVRSPGGILIECTANVPRGLYLDESPEELGTKLHLPPWYDEQSEAIVAMLEPLVVPETNRPRPGTLASRSHRTGVEKTEGPAFSRTTPKFTTPQR